MSESTVPDFTNSVDIQFSDRLTYSIISSILGLVALVVVVIIIVTNFSVPSILGLVALVVVVIIIVRCRKAGKSILINYNARTASNTPAPPMQVAMQVIPDSKLKMAMMEKFINGIVREKPIRFSPHQLANFTRNYTTRLGSGAYGVVYKGAFPNGVQIAVKVLNGRLNEVVEEQFMAEVGTIGRTHHINLVHLYGFCFDAATFVYEYMGNGSVDKLLFNKDRPIGLDVLHKIAVGTAKGITYIHEGCNPRIIHYDIKPENVLLDENFTPKVADFGLAKLCSWNRSQLTNFGFKGTPGYAAPEMWAPYPITFKCDVYSFGMFLFEIVGRRRNLDDKATESQKWFPRRVWDKFENGDLVRAMDLYGIEEEDRGMAKRMAVIALWCVQYKPETRPPMSSVVKMLEGEMEIIAPPNPFQHLMPSKEAVTAWTESDTNSTGEIDCKSTTTLMGKYEIEMA